MSIYNYDSNIVAEQLTPPVLRKSKFLSWLYVIVKPIHNLWSNVFESYKIGDISLDYNNASSYVFGDKVKYTDNSIYQLIVSSSIGVNPLNTTNWVKLNDNFIGTNERVKINSQIILLEYYLNKWYNVSTLSDQIYIENIKEISNIFQMSISSIYSSTMPLNSNYSETYMGLEPTYPDVSVDFNVCVPIALYTTLGDNNDNRDNNIKNIIDKYKLSGIRYKIETY